MREWVEFNAPPDPNSRDNNLLTNKYSVICRHHCGWLSNWLHVVISGRILSCAGCGFGNWRSGAWIRTVPGNDARSSGRWQWTSAAWRAVSISWTVTRAWHWYTARSSGCTYATGSRISCLLALHHQSNRSICDFLLKLSKTTLRSTEVKTAELSLEQKGLQLIMLCCEAEKWSGKFHILPKNFRNFHGIFPGKIPHISITMILQ